MGLRTASVRHPHVEVMAPAQTETNQTPTFKLPPENQSASPINSNTKHESALFIASACKSLPAVGKENKNNVNNGFNGLEIAATEDTTLKGDTLSEASDNTFVSTTMSDCLTSMGDQQDGTMGLQKVTLDDVNDLLKNDSEVDQIFNNLPTGDADEIMEVLSLSEDLFSVDMMNMSMEEQEAAESAEEAKVKERLGELNCKQVELEKKLDYLQRRVRKFQMRQMGQHVSGEIVGVFEHVNRTFKRCKDDKTLVETAVASSTSTDAKDNLQPMSYSSAKSLIKKLELSNATLSKRPRKRDINGIPGRSFNHSHYITLPKWSPRSKQDLQKISGNLEAELRLVQEELDSDATVSSSGGESCDETENYNNQHQEYLDIPKRASWKYNVNRASVACKWTWLQSQVADLDYKIRKRAELLHDLRNKNPSVQLGSISLSQEVMPVSQTALNGYRGQLPGAPAIRNGESCTSTKTTDYQCARTRPLENYHKRKLIQVKGLHYVSKKTARPSTVRCSCGYSNNVCMLCTGRIDPTRPRDLSEYLSKNEMFALLDPSYHSVFSLNDAISASFHIDAVTSTVDWQQRTNRTNIKVNSKLYLKGERTEKPSSEQARPRTKNSEHRKKCNRLIKPSTANALSAKIKNRHRGKNHRPRTKKRARMSSAVSSLGSDGNDEEMEGLGMSTGGKFDSPSASPLLTHAISGYQKQRSRADSYDIDNIIIPYSVASSTRVEKLQYKEILTPKWRIVDENPSTIIKHDTKNNGVVKTSQNTDEANDKDAYEDLSDTAVQIRHEKSEQDEKKKFLSYLKLPYGYSRSRANRRTDSLAESSGANTPDPMSPAPIHMPESTVVASAPTSLVPMTLDKEKEKDYSPIISPPATPMPEIGADPIPQSALRRRASSQTRPNRDNEIRSNSPDDDEESPYEKRVFPLQDDIFDDIVRNEDDNRVNKPNPVITHESPPNSPANLPTVPLNRPPNNITAGNKRETEHDSESTESAFGDEDPDPNDPEWEGEENDKERFNV